MSEPLRPLRVCVVGAGPGGLYAAEALLAAAGIDATVDVVDRLPAPYGLVRYGVAADHPKIKRVSKRFDGVLASDAVHFVGNVELGTSATVDELRRFYDCIVYAIGNESDRDLGVPGEDLADVRSATELVGWYNGHPRFVDATFRFDAHRVAIVGVGNVAMDVARILGKDPDELAPYDMPQYALDALRGAARHLETIHVLARRGPAQAAFTPAEIRELGELERCDLAIDPRELELDPESAKAIRGRAGRQARKNVEYLRERAARPCRDTPRRIVLRFLCSPVRFRAGAHGRLAGMDVERNALVAGPRGLAARGTGEVETLAVEQVFKSIGYRGVPVPGVPFDDALGRIPNDAGRVVERAGGAVRPGEYVVGWAARGPIGLIGDNKGDAQSTVAALVEDVAADPCGARRADEPARGALAALLRARGVRATDLDDWRRIDAEERARGEAAGKSREKFVRVEEMIAFLDGG